MNLPMTPEYLAWKEYQRFESEFIEACEYVELDDKHYEVYSYKFLNLITAIGIEFDTVCRALIAKCLKNGTFKDSDLAARLLERQKGALLNMGDYRVTLEHLFKGSSRAVGVNRLGVWDHPLAPPPDESGNSLAWWKAFTALKHDRIGNFVKSATMQNVIRALAALLIIDVYFCGEGGKVTLPGLELSQIFTVKFLKVTTRTMGVGETTYSLIDQ